MRTPSDDVMWLIFRFSFGAVLAAVGWLCARGLRGAAAPRPRRKPRAD